MGAKNGDFVTINYVLMTEEGEKIESNPTGEPIGFMVGSGDIIQGIEEEVVGMEIGDSKEMVVEPDRAFGEYVEGRVQQVPREIAADYPLQVGDIVDMETEDGELIKALVRELDEEFVTIDLNHPLAGLTIKMQIELVGIG